LKSQPTQVVVAQLRRIEQGEPALSPSITARVLQDFRREPAAAPPDRISAVSVMHLTDREVDVLRLIAKGYKSSELAELLGPEQPHRDRLCARHLSQAGHFFAR